MKNEKKYKILNDEDFIDYPKFKNSLSKLIEKNPDGVDTETIAKALNMSKEEVEEIYMSAIQKLKNNLDL